MNLASIVSGDARIRVQTFGNGWEKLRPSMLASSTSAVQQILSDSVSALSEHQAMGRSSLGQPAAVCNAEGARADLPVGCRFPVPGKFHFL